MRTMRTAAAAGTAVAGIAALAAVLSSAGMLAVGDAGRAVSSALSLYGVATVVHAGADGAVIGTQEAHNRLLDGG